MIGSRTSRTSRTGCILGAALWLLIILPALAAIGLVAFYEFDHTGRVYDGVRIGEVPVGGLTVERATLAVRERYAPAPSATLTLRDGARSWSLTPAELGLALDARGAAQAAYAVGRQGASSDAVGPLSPLISLQTDLAAQWRVYRGGYVITPTLAFDENRLALALKRIAREVDVPPREGQLTFTGLQVTGTPGASGRLVNLEATRARLLPLLLAGQGGVLDLVVEDREPAVKSVEEAVVRANNVLSRPLELVLTGADTVLRDTVERATLRDWLAFAPEVRADGKLDVAVRPVRAPIEAYLAALAARTDRPAQDAALDFDRTRNQLVVLTPSRAGQALDVAAGLAAISDTVRSLAASIAPAAREVPLPVRPLTPTVDSRAIARLGIIELVSEGTTTFTGSSRERVQNIVAAAQKFRNVVVPPGEEFSFNEHVGEINAANGFVDSYIIWGDRTAVGIGGGVCQVSTTAFRAAFFGGFPITERWAHGYVVSWYGDPGLDATIYTPYVDLRFRNDTGHFLLIKAEVDQPNSRISFYFYGTKPLRTVEAGKPVIANVRPPEGPVYQEDLTLAPGTIRQVDWARNGMDVVVTRRVRAAGGQVTEDEFVSQYQPWRSVFLFGPGAALPVGVTVLPANTPVPAATRPLP